MTEIKSKKVGLPVLILAIIVSLLAGHFGGALIQREMTYPANNTFAVIGKVVINTKDLLPSGELRLKVADVQLMGFGEGEAVTFGISRNMPKDNVLVIKYVDKMLDYAKSGANIVLICKEGQDTFFNCSYKVAPGKIVLEPTPTLKLVPTLKPTPKPKPTSKPKTK